MTRESERRFVVIIVKEQYDVCAKTLRSGQDKKIRHLLQLPVTPSGMVRGFLAFSAADGPG